MIYIYVIRFGKYNSIVDVGTGAVGRGTALLTVKSWVLFLMMSLEFFLHIIHPAVLCV